MTEREHQTDQGDELDLDAETVRDLEPSDEDAEDVRGGSLGDTTVPRLCCAATN
jgi:hypothetical protein